jgi:ornithine cyclodeaminase/alanine dehydrogenase-like protein (mu-crystallin family)
MKSKVVCDYTPSCLAEAGDIIIPINEGTFTDGVIHADLGELVTGLKEARESEEEITLFKSVGLSIQDVAVAKHVYDKSVVQDIGVNFKFS